MDIYQISIRLVLSDEQMSNYLGLKALASHTVVDLFESN